LIETGSEGRRQLQLFPATPIAGTGHFRVEGRLAVAAEERVHVPHARLEGAASVREYVALPAQKERQTLSWEIRGLKPASLPDGLLPGGGAPSIQTFEAVSEQYTAELQSVEELADEIQVRFADIAVSWNGDSSYYGAASYDVDPAGKTSCRLALPADCRLIDLRVDGRLLPVEPAGALRWIVPLAGGRLPQRIEVIFAGQWTGDSHVPTVIEAPRLIGLPIERALWTISGPLWAGPVRAETGAVVSELQGEMARHESIARSMAAAAGTLQAARDEAPRWYRTWATRLSAARRAADRAQVLDHSAEDSLKASEELASWEEELRRLAEQLGVADLLTQLEGSPPSDEFAGAMGIASSPSLAGEFRTFISGPTPALRVDYPRRYTGDLAGRTGAVIVVAVVLLAAVALLLHTTAFQWLSSRPRLVGVIFGLFWWLFLWPSGVGWLIVVCSALFGQITTIARRIGMRYHRARASY
jgi:hypothetical protein